jgi:hypothetical protein
MLCHPRHPPPPTPTPTPKKNNETDANIFARGYVKKYLQKS